MPLIHSKRPAAFKKNVETELEHGKPFKQSLAIAYREAGEHRADGGMCAHGGPVHCNMGCYAEGGEVGVHEASELSGPGVSKAGSKARYAGYMKEVAPDRRERALGEAKEMHKSKLEELRTMKGPHGNYAEGGDVEPLDEPMKDDGDEELEDSLAQELLHAMEKKDKRGVRDAIEALVLQCMNKGGGDV